MWARAAGGGQKTLSEEVPWGVGVEGDTEWSEEESVDMGAFQAQRTASEIVLQLWDEP